MWILVSDGQIIVSGGDDHTVRLRNQDGTLIQSFEHQGRIWSVAVDRNAQTVVSGSADGTVKLWHQGNNSPAQIFEGHQGTVWSVAITPDGQTIVSGSSDGTVKTVEAQWLSHQNVGEAPRTSSQCGHYS